jgi:hypothetical protein
MIVSFSVRTLTYEIIFGLGMIASGWAPVAYEYAHLGDISNLSRFTQQELAYAS